MNYFSDHLKEAIEINRKRKKIYAAMTCNRSNCVSRSLIFIESGALPAAYWIDAQAKKFHTIGIPVIERDLVPMLPLPPADAPPQYTKKAAKLIFSQLKATLKQYGQSLKWIEFSSAAKRSAELLQEIGNMEKEQQCHFAMTRHLIESIGLAALNAPQYAAASCNATVSLSKMFIRMQSWGLQGSLWLDKKAQEMHALGAGIIVNDVPYIPFEEEFSRANLR